MTFSNQAGRLYEIEGGKLELFGYTWGTVSASKTWVIYHPSICFLPGWGNEYSPDLVSLKISKVIGDDIKAGKEANIAYVGVEPIVAIKLWLEGVIDRNHFKHCTQVGEMADEPEDVYIELHNVILAGQPRIVRIYPFPDFSYATFDSDGNEV